MCTVRPTEQCEAVEEDYSSAVMGIIQYAVEHLERALAEKLQDTK